MHSIDEANREARQGCYPELDLPEPPNSENYESAPGPVCDAECTRDIICGYDGCTEPTAGSQTVSTLPPRPCRPSTYHACDPEEPMELPAYGCDYLERDYAGNVRCAG